MKKAIEDIELLGIDLKDGLTISHPGADENSSENIFDHICKLIMVTICYLGVALCINQSFVFGANCFVVTAVLGIISIYLYVFKNSNEKLKRFKNISIIIVVLVLLIFFRDRIFSAFVFMFVRLVTEYGTYYGFDVSQFEADSYSLLTANLALLALLLPFSIAQVNVIRGKLTIRWTFSFLVFYLLLMFLCGHMPDVIPMLLILISFICQICIENLCFNKHTGLTVKSDNSSRAGLKGGAVIICALLLGVGAFLGYGFFYKNVENVMGPIRTTVYTSSFTELFNRIKGGYSSGGINGGNLNTGNGVRFDNSAHLVISYDKQQKDYTYLKGYTGSKYTGSDWRELDKTAYMTTAYNKLSAYSESDILSLQFKIIELAKKINSKLFSNATITTLKVELPNQYVSDGKYVCIPYNGLVSDEDGDITDLGYLTRRDYEEENYYNLFTYPTRKAKFSSVTINLVNDVYDYNSYINGVAGIIDDKLKEAIELEKCYQSFVYDNYLEVPASCQKIFDEYSGKSEKYKNDIVGAINYVQNSLSNSARYSLDTPATPLGYDMIEYFLYESHVGYCTHFASAGVMMFRSMGIPARYVQGYLIAPVDKDKEIVVTDKYAHAWVEIYMDGFGWIAVEVTPNSSGESGSYTPDTNDVVAGSDSTLPDSTKTTAEETTAVKETTTYVEKTTQERTYENSSASGDSETSATTEKHSAIADNSNEETQTANTYEEQDSTHTSGTQEDGTTDYGQIIIVLFYVLIGILVICIFVLAFWLRRASKIKIRNSYFTRKNNNQAVIGMFSDLCNISGKYSFEINENSDYNELSGIYSFDEESFNDYIRISLKAMFSNSEITTEERRIVTAFYKKTIKEIGLSQKGFNRFKIKFIDGV